MKSCTIHRHEHRDLPCPWPECENNESVGELVEVSRHAGAGRMTAAEGRFELAPAPRRFARQQWSCNACAKSGWYWVEVGAEPRADRCPHRRTGTVKPIERR